MINNRSFHMEMKVFTTEERIGSEEIFGLSISVSGLQLRWMSEFFGYQDFLRKNRKKCNEPEFWWDCFGK